MRSASVHIAARRLLQQPFLLHLVQGALKLLDDGVGRFLVHRQVKIDPAQGQRDSERTDTGLLRLVLTGRDGGLPHVELAGPQLGWRVYQATLHLDTAVDQVLTTYAAILRADPVLPGIVQAGDLDRAAGSLEQHDLNLAERTDPFVSGLALGRTAEGEHGEAGGFL